VKKETIVAFDFDGTLTTKDTLIEFIAFTKGRWRLYGGFLLFSPLLIAMRLKLLPNWKVKQWLFSYFFKNTPIEIFDKWGTEFSTIVDQMLCPKMMEVLQSHKNKDDSVVIVSASIENWIKPWATKMGINTVIATQIETDLEHQITGKFLTKNCYGQEKVNRLLERFPNRNDYHLIAYGDSCGDREMIKFAEHGVHLLDAGNIDITIKKLPLNIQ